MIRFVVTRHHSYTLEKLLGGGLGERRIDCRILTWERLFTSRRVPRGTYIFSDLERLTPWETQAAGEACRSLRSAGCLVLNDPARAAARYELLRRLHDAGINDFDALRADEGRVPGRFPVFLRFEFNHDKPLSDLIHSAEVLAKSLSDLALRGIPLRGVLIVGFRGEAYEPGVYRKYSTFRIGDRWIAHHIVNQNHWVAKYGDPGVLRPDWVYEFEREFVETNGHAEVLSRAFEVASIDYGRADFNVVDGRVQIYEINTNPTLGGAAAGMSPMRIETLRKSNGSLLDALAALDQPSTGQVRLDFPSLAMARKTSKSLADVLSQTPPRP